MKKIIYAIIINIGLTTTSGAFIEELVLSAVGNVISINDKEKEEKKKAQRHMEQINGAWKINQLCLKGKTNNFKRFERVNNKMKVKTVSDLSSKTLNHIRASNLILEEMYKCNKRAEAALKLFKKENQ